MDTKMDMDMEVEMKVIDLIPSINYKKDMDQYRYICEMITLSTTTEDKEYWTQMKLSFYFDQYFKQTGDYHPKDPAAISEMEAY